MSFLDDAISTVNWYFTIHISLGWGMVVVILGSMALISALVVPRVTALLKTGILVLGGAFFFRFDRPEFATLLMLLALLQVLSAVEMRFMQRRMIRIDDNADRLRATVERFLEALDRRTREVDYQAASQGEVGLVDQCSMPKSDLRSDISSQSR